MSSQDPSPSSKRSSCSEVENETPKKQRRPPKLSLEDLSDAVRNLAPAKTPMSRHTSRAGTPLQLSPKTVVRRKAHDNMSERIFRAVAGLNVELLKDTLGAAESFSSKFVNERDDFGYTPLLCAVALEGPDQTTQAPEVQENIVALLLDAGADPFVNDEKGWNCLHWCAACGTKSSMEVLFQVCDLNFQRDRDTCCSCTSKLGDTPLHVAARHGRMDIMKYLIDQGSKPSTLNWLGQSAADVACKPVDEQWKPSVESEYVRHEVRELLHGHDPFGNMLLLHHELCQLHCPHEGHQESPARTSSLLTAVRERLPGFEYTEISNFDIASDNILLLSHESSYLEDLKAIECRISTAGSTLPFTPQLQRRRMDQKGVPKISHEKLSAIRKDADMILSDDSSTVGEGSPLDNVCASPLFRAPSLQQVKDWSDTSFSLGTLNAARAAAGGVVEAVKRLLQGNKQRRAAVAVRPPGHHAGPVGLSTGALSCGFCVFNNVAIGAFYAIDNFPQVKRVAIIDIDAHHGNGTEEAIRWAAGKRRWTPASSPIFFASVHLFHKSSTFGEFYPGTGEADDTVANFVNCPITPLWASKKSKGGKVGREAWKESIERRIAPALRSFHPDLTIISAGLDGGRNDVGNASRRKDRTQQGLDLQPTDFEWVARTLREVTEYVGGKTVVVLEGGYGHWEKGEDGNFHVSVRSFSENAVHLVKGLCGSTWIQDEVLP
uniref:histone deacetylase n=1 Tax=Palpitomonas bilix TaxID=652834 RepID=A0A7S3GF02_9EUKA